MLNLGFKNCLYCRKPIKLKIRRDVKRKKFCNYYCHARYYIQKETFGGFGHIVSENTKEILRQKRTERGVSWKGRNNPNYKGVIHKNTKISEKHKSILSERMLNGGAAKARKACGGRKTKIEQIVEDYLIQNKIDYRPQEIINNHAVDFLIEPRFIIESDGNYWHSLPIQIERDKEFNQFCKDNEYQLLRLKEKDIIGGNYSANLGGKLCFINNERS